jgi:fatty-acyl-CoA synthase
MRESDDLYQMYTSGTTGRPKGAVLTHGAVTSHLEQVSPFFRLREGERGLGVAPMYHAAGCLLAFRTVADGGSVYLMAEFDPAEVVRVLDEERIGAAIMVPAMIQACLVSAPDVDTRRYNDLRTIYYGSSPIAAETLRRAMAVFGCDFNQAYGMTELTAGSTNLSAEDHRRALTDRPELLLSAGRPLMGVQIRIVDEEDRAVADGETGEILMRGPQMMRGYWNMPDETAEALRGGWMHTGDVGRVDADGYLYVMDRLKDMIVSGGENVYPRAVEDVLFAHPSIADAAVIGVPDDRWGETVKAIVVLRDGSSASEAELIDYCRDRLGGLQRPRSVEFRDALPHAANGKMLKRVLRDPYWAGRERRIGGS